MGKCQYCGHDAGLLRKKHPNCEQRYLTGKSEIIGLVPENIFGEERPLRFLDSLKVIATENFISMEDLRELIIEGWENAVEKALEDNILSIAEEEKLLGFATELQFKQDELDRNGAYARVFKGGILREILDGKIPERVTINGPTPFNLQKSEQIVWIFQNVKLYEQITRRQYVGGSRGVGVRVAKGLYFRVGNFQGHSINVNETHLSDAGYMGVTTKHIYFSGGEKHFRIPYGKIVAFVPYDDGIEIQRDGVRAKPQLFETGDGWFTYNLLTNLAQL